MKLLILFGAALAVGYWLWNRKQITGTVTALYSEAKVSTPGNVSPGDSAENALIGPSQFSY
jgi:hypothetical protein